MLKNCIFNFAELLYNHDWDYQRAEGAAYAIGVEQKKKINQFIKNHEPIRNTLEKMYATANPYKNGEISN